jgi:hypothetical protein
VLIIGLEDLSFECVTKMPLDTKPLTSD